MTVARSSHVDDVPCRPTSDCPSPDTASPEECRRHKCLMMMTAYAARAGSWNDFGGPFGAAVVKNKIVIAIAHNTVLSEGNPTCHAEMNAIRMACKTLRTHDLSDCDIYTTCEPCPMCWGAVHWARLKRMFIGIDKKTAAMFGWSDEFYYTELGKPAIERTIKTTTVTCSDTLDSVHQLFTSNPTHRRKMALGGNYLRKIYEETFVTKASMLTKGGKEADTQDQCETSPRRDVPQDYTITSTDQSEATRTDVDNVYMREAVALAQKAMKGGSSKEREPFSTLIIKDDRVVGRGHNQVLMNHDPTATSEIVAICDACQNLKTHDLSGCVMYSTGEPDVMSMGAIYWAGLKEVHIGYSLADAAAAGFEDGLMHYVELNATPDHEKVLWVQRNVAFDECRKVFEEYSHRSGKLY